jgi:hypothetical protein
MLLSPSIWQSQELIWFQLANVRLATLEVLDFLEGQPRLDCVLAICCRLRGVGRDMPVGLLLVSGHRKTPRIRARCRESN